MKGIWEDNRSGKNGKAIGNMVLGHIHRKTGKPIKHEKGTVFSTEDTLLVGRVCTNDSYLSGDTVHFCNMSMAQHESITSSWKKSFYLFISVKGRIIHYWLVPGNVIGKILPTLAVKDSTPASIIRIVSEDGKVFWLGGVNITRYHSTILLRKSIKLRPNRPIRRTGRKSQTKVKQAIA